MMITHLLQLVFENIGFIVLCLFLDLIVDQRNILGSFLLYNPLLDSNLQHFLLSLGISNSLQLTSIAIIYNVNFVTFSNSVSFLIVSVFCCCVATNCSVHCTLTCL